MRPLGEWADLLYTEYGELAHVVPFGLGRYSLCGAAPLTIRGWFGTGSMDEYDRAAALPLCTTCKGKLDD